MPQNWPKRGEIYLANLDPVVGSEQGGRRPVLILQNDVTNQYSPVTIVAGITSAPTRVNYPVDVRINDVDTGLRSGSRVLLNQLKTVDQTRLERYIGRLSAQQMEQVDAALKLRLGLDAV